MLATILLILRLQNFALSASHSLYSLLNLMILMRVIFTLELSTCSDWLQSVKGLEIPGRVHFGVDWVFRLHSWDSLLSVCDPRTLNRKRLIFPICFRWLVPMIELNMHLLGGVHGKGTLEQQDSTISISGLKGLTSFIIKYLWQNLLFLHGSLINFLVLFIFRSDIPFHPFISNFSIAFQILLSISEFIQMLIFRLYIFNFDAD